MNVRCPYCRTSFNLSRDYVAQAVAEATEQRQKYHGVECFNCRKVVKVPIVQMKRFVPDTPPESESEAESEKS